jgi:hypothetical protein
MSINTQHTLSKVIQENLVNGRLSLRAVARLLAIRDISIILDAQFANQKLAQILTEQGFEAAQLVKDGFCAKSFWLTLEYFAYESKADGAKRLAHTFSQIGVMTAFDKLEVKPDVVAPKVYSIQENIECARTLYALPDGYLKELLRDALVAELSQKQLAATKPEYIAVAVRATELGYSLQQIGTGRELGRYAKNLVEPAFRERVGKYDTWYYLLNDRLDEAIHSYFR